MYLCRSRVPSGWRMRSDRDKQGPACAAAEQERSDPSQWSELAGGGTGTAGRRSGSQKPRNARPFFSPCPHPRSSRGWPSEGTACVLPPCSWTGTCCRETAESDILCRSWLILRQEVVYERNKSSSYLMIWKKSRRSRIILLFYRRAPKKCKSGYKESPNVNEK